jgi:hypothetical protein
MDLLFKLAPHVWAMPTILFLSLIIMLKDREAFFRLGALLMVSIFVNTVVRYELKHTFPDPALLVEYTRPAPHVQFVTVFYGSFFFELLKGRSLWIPCTLSAFFTLIASIIASNNYYDAIDVISAIVLGYFMLIVFYIYAIKAQVSLRLRALVMSFIVLIYSVMKIRSLVHSGANEGLIVSVLNMLITTFPYLLLLGGLWIGEKTFQSLYERANVSRTFACAVVLCTSITALLFMYHYKLLDVSHTKIVHYRSFSGFNHTGLTPMHFSNSELCRGFAVACAIKRMLGNFMTIFVISHLGLLPLYLISLFRKKEV